MREEPFIDSSAIYENVSGKSRAGVTRPLPSRGAELARATRGQADVSRLAGASE